VVIAANFGAKVAVNEIGRVADSGQLVYNLEKTTDSKEIPVSCREKGLACEEKVFSCCGKVIACAEKRVEGWWMKYKGGLRMMPEAMMGCDAPS
jgi:hypothetical protein